MVVHAASLGAISRLSSGLFGRELCLLDHRRVASPPRARSKVEVGSSVVHLRSEVVLDLLDRNNNTLALCC